MSDTTPGTCRVERFRCVPTKHPLATRGGIEAVASIVAANQYWRPLNRRARQALRRAYENAVAEATPGDTIPLPAIQAGTHPLTVGALERRGLVAHGRMTPLGVEVTSWALLAARRRHPEQR